MDPTSVYAGLGPVSGHPNFYIWWSKKYGSGVDLVLIKGSFQKDSVSLKWANVFFFQIKVAYKKDAKENLHYTTVADRPDIKKATQAAKQASEVRVCLEGTQSQVVTANK